jgi:hypothetical protein
MAVRLLVPRLGFEAGDILDRGEASDAKWIASGLAEKVREEAPKTERAKSPKGMKHGSA